MNPLNKRKSMPGLVIIALVIFCSLSGCRTKIDFSGDEMAANMDIMELDADITDIELITMPKISMLGGFSYAGCDEDDAGKDFFTKGESEISYHIEGSKRTVNLTDICSGDFIEEYYCSENGVAKSTYKCPASCRYGACIGTCKTENACKGSIPGFEYLCDDDGNSSGLGSNICGCDDSCNAVVLKPACYETKQASNVFMKITALAMLPYGNEVEHPSICVDRHTRKSYRCMDGALVENITTCPGECREGACMCFDSDGPEGFATAGFATGLQPGFDGVGYTELEDNCVDAAVVEEALCNASGYVKTTWRVCPAGCADGACIREDSGYLVELMTLSCEVLEERYATESSALERGCVYDQDCRQMDSGGCGECLSREADVSRASDIFEVRIQKGCISEPGCEAVRCECRSNRCTGIIAG